MPEHGACLGARFDAAVQYALTVHAGQMRKGTSVPYVSHLFAVTALVLEDGGDEEQAIAALLHDTAEDHGGKERLADVCARFGNRVAEIVAGCTDTFESPKPRWRPRKEAYLKRLTDEPAYVLRVSVADKLHNARAMWCDWEREGIKTFERFNAGPADQRWYFGALRDIFSAHLEESSLTLPFKAIVEQIKREWP